jgi:hypothetical protein
MSVFFEKIGLLQADIPAARSNSSFIIYSVCGTKTLRVVVYEGETFYPRPSMRSARRLEKSLSRLHGQVLRIKSTEGGFTIMTSPLQIMKFL